MCRLRFCEVRDGISILVYARILVDTTRGVIRALANIEDASFYKNQLLAVNYLCNTPPQKFESVLNTPLTTFVDYN